MILPQSHIRNGMLERNVPHHKRESIWSIHVNMQQNNLGWHSPRGTMIRPVTLVVHLVIMMERECSSTLLQLQVGLILISLKFVKVKWFLSNFFCTSLNQKNYRCRSFVRKFPSKNDPPQANFFLDLTTHKFSATPSKSSFYLGLRRRGGRL